MLRISLVALLATLSFAQTAAPPLAPPQPSAEVDGALRARIKEFYGLLVDHQFRKAEAIVAPDYRDIYYEHDKPRYTSFELTSIAYSPDFTRADVMVTIKMPPLHPLIPASTPVPLPSIWRLLDGDWYWSLRKIDPLEMLHSLVGGNPTPPTAGAVPGLPPIQVGGLGSTPALQTNPNLPAGLGRPEAITTMTPGGAVLPAFTMDRSQVTLKPSTTEAVTISNTGSGPMTLFVLGKLAGIDAALDRSRIGPGEKAILSIHAAADAEGGALLIGVTETKGMTTLTVTVK
jgi:hypothetical protein